MQSHVQLEGGDEVDGMEMRFQCESHAEVDWRGLWICLSGPLLAIYYAENQSLNILKWAVPKKPTA